MITVRTQILNSSNAISQNIENLSDNRELLSQNLLAQIRNLIEGVAVLFSKNSLNSEFKYEDISPSIDGIKGNGRLNYICRFHSLVQKIASHYTLDGDASERLMLKYYEYLFRMRASLQQRFSLSIIPNLENFPIDLDPSLREYHEKIASRIENIRKTPRMDGKKDRYYIQKVCPFITHGQIYYEVTFCRAINKTNKFDRIIAFTDLDISGRYAVNLTLKRDQIEVLNQIMPITIILSWEVSIRSHELKNFARIFGLTVSGNTASHEYHYLMGILTNGYHNLVDLMDISDEHYLFLKAEATKANDTQQIFPVLDRARTIVRKEMPGGIILRYLLSKMRNDILKPQYSQDACGLLSSLKLKYGCIPFDQMPFCSSLPGHNPRFLDVVDCIDLNDRNHELLARHVRNNVEQRGALYSPIKEMPNFSDDIEALVDKHNQFVYAKHRDIRSLQVDKQHVFINGYENDTYKIVEKLKEYSKNGVSGYTDAIERWLDESGNEIDDESKVHALKQLFSNSRVALIYGAAGTGKSTLVNHIAHFFNDKRKLFLAHTNPAIDNLERKVTAQNSEFRTLSKHINSKFVTQSYDLLVIDECSTVSNTDILDALERGNYKLVVLVGDVYQIESIQFGNWFEIIRSFIPSTSIFELTTPFRANDQNLLNFWKRVREIGDDLAEIMARNNYSSDLDSSIFESQGSDEIVLCLNYDGLYGINNINRFLQSSNSNEAVVWGDATYKVGDPVLFFDTERFRPVIYNNLKGTIKNIELSAGQIQFEVELDRAVTEIDVDGDDLEWVRGSIVRFSVYETTNNDEDDESYSTVVPFQVAYAVSIHKAQGLEYDSVKIVITNANEDNISHSILYTAVTRARRKLKIFWSPEAQQKILQRLQRVPKKKEVELLISRRGLTRATE